MKKRTVAIVFLGVCTIFASVYGDIVITQPTTTSTTTTTKVTTAADGTTTEETTTTTTTTEEDYTYLEYDGVVPYYRGYYYINGVWVWRGRGKAPFPPPKRRPLLTARSLKPAVKHAPAKRTTPVRAASHHRGGGRTAAPKGPRR